MKIIIRTTNDYPHYQRSEEEYKTYDEAMDRFNALSKELCAKCNKGELQDYRLELREN